MTPDAFRAALAALGLSQARLARILGLRTSTTQRWAQGERPIPVAVAILLRLAEAGRITPEEMDAALR